jgi:hypothetical protein
MSEHAAPADGDRYVQTNEIRTDIIHSSRAVDGPW